MIGGGSGRIAGAVAMRGASGFRATSGAWAGSGVRWRIVVAQALDRGTREIIGVAAFIGCDGGRRDGSLDRGRWDRNGRNRLYG